MLEKKKLPAEKPSARRPIGNRVLDSRIVNGEKFLGIECRTRSGLFSAQGCYLSREFFGLAFSIYVVLIVHW